MPTTLLHVNDVRYCVHILIISKCGDITKMQAFQVEHCLILSVFLEFDSKRGIYLLSVAWFLLLHQVHTNILRGIVVLKGFQLLCLRLQ